MNLTEKGIEKFWSLVDVREENECWLWKGGHTGGGYGVLYINDSPQRAHRIAWSLANGRDPLPGMVIGHAPIICHNRSCCNPNHLSEKTKQENVRDMQLDGTKPQGESHGRAKTTLSDVNQIRNLYKKGLTQQHISEIFGLSRAHIGRIVAGERWQLNSAR